MRIFKRRFMVLAGLAGLTAVALTADRVRAEMADVEIRANQRSYPAKKVQRPRRFFGNDVRGFFNFSNVFRGVRRFGLRNGEGAESRFVPAPANVRLSIAYAHRRQYRNRSYQYFHHYPYNYFGHPYRPGFRVSLTK